MTIVTKLKLAGVYKVVPKLIFDNLTVVYATSKNMTKSLCEPITKASIRKYGVLKFEILFFFITTFLTINFKI